MHKIRSLTKCELIYFRLSRQLKSLLCFQINNQVLYGRSHLNASAIIKSAASRVRLILLR